MSVSVLFVTAALSQYATDVRISSSFPFLGSVIQAPQERRDGGRNLLQSSAGSIYVVNLTRPDVPTLSHEPIVFEAPGIGSFVNDIAPREISKTDGSFYVAGGFGGLFKVDSHTYKVTGSHRLGDARTVAVCGGGSVVVVGTRSFNGERAGIHAFSADTLAPLWERPAAGDVWSVACHDSGGAAKKGEYLLAVGGYCGTRLTVYRASSSRADALASYGDDSLFVNDLRFLDGGEVLVAAANARGVVALRLPAPSATSQPSLEELWTLETGGYAEGLSLSAASTRETELVVASSASYSAQHQFFGGCAAPVPCDKTIPGFGSVVSLSPPFDASPRVSFNVTDHGGYLCAFDGAKPKANLHNALLWPTYDLDETLLLVALCPWLAIMPQAGGSGSTSFLAPINHQTYGFHGNGFDSIAISAAGDAIYVSVETTLATFCLTGHACATKTAVTSGAVAKAPTAPLALSPAAAPTLRVLNYSETGCIAIGADVHATRLYCSLQSSGIGVFSTSGAATYAPEYLGKFTQPGVPVRAYAPPFATAALPRSASQQWLYAMMSATRLTIFDVSAPTVDAFSVLATAEVDGIDGVFGFGMKVLQTPDAHYAYVSYCTLFSETEREIGIVVFQATPPSSRGDGSRGADLMLQQKRIVRVSNSSGLCENAQAAYVTIDKAGSRLYAAYSCAGVAMFDISSPEAPALLGFRQFGGQMVLNVLVGPPLPSELIFVSLPATTQEATAAAQQRGTGVGIINVSTVASFEHGPLQVLPVALTNIDHMLLPATSGAREENEGKVKMIVAGGASGVYELAMSLV
jgi:outer membrane protein assembly factor BamB